MTPRKKAQPLCAVPARVLTDRELVKILCGFISTFAYPANADPNAPASGPQFTSRDSMRNAILWLADNVDELTVAWRQPPPSVHHAVFARYLDLVDKIFVRAGELKEGDLSAGACWEALLPELEAAGGMRLSLGVDLQEKGP